MNRRFAHIISCLRINIFRCTLLVGVILMNVTTIAQGKRYELNERLLLSTSYYDVFEKNIPVSLLDRYISFLESIGDKNVGVRIIFKKWIFTQPQTNLAKDIDTDLLLLDIPNIPNIPKYIEGENDIYRYHTFTFLVISNELLNNRNDFFNAITEIMAKLTLIAPNLFSEEIDEALENDYLQFILKHSDEIDSLQKYFNQQINPENKELTSDDYHKLTEKILEEIHNRYPLIDLFFSRNSVKEETEIFNSIIPRTAVDTDLKEFIESTYMKLLDRLPDEQEFRIWHENFTNDKTLKPSILYYILMTSEEYMYF